MSILWAIINAISKWFDKKPSPPPAPSPSPIPLPTNEEELLIKLVNDQRISAGLSPLKKDDKLMKAAGDYARLMATTNKLDHGINGTIGSRITAVNYKWVNVGENIGWNYKNAQKMVAGWMSSIGHKANILNKNYVDTGVGIADVGNGPFYCQVFAKPR